MKKLVSIVLVIFVLLVCPTVNYAKAKDCGTKVVVLMYHGLVADGKRNNTYVIDKNTLEKDVNYLLNRGYEIITTADLLSVTKGKKVPHKQYAILTFDDGFYGNMKYGLPIFEKYGISAVFAVVGKYASSKEYTDKSSVFSYMDWNDIQKISKQVEIASHSYDMHNLDNRRGVGKIKGENNKNYLETIKKDFTKIDELITNYATKPITFAYPYGIYNKITEELLDTMGYKVTLTCNVGINYINSERDLKLLKRINRNGKISTKDFMNKYNI